MEELKFTCELCGKEFEPSGDCIVECSMEICIVDEETDEVLEVTEEEKKEILETISDNPQYKAFQKGTVCLCPECQNSFEDEEE